MTDSVSSSIDFPSIIRSYIDDGYFYTIRLDISEAFTDEENKHELKEILKFLQAELYVIYEEKSSVVEKPHFQGYFFRKRLITKYFKEVVISKEFKSRYTHYCGTKRSIALVTSETYLSYASKDGLLFISQFPTAFDGDEFLSCIPHWKPISHYLKSSAKKSLKNDIFDINPAIWVDKKLCVEEIVRIFITHKRPFTYYQIISHYNVLHASHNLKEVVDDILEKMEN